MSTTNASNSLSADLLEAYQRGLQEGALLSGGVSSVNGGSVNGSGVNGGSANGGAGNGSTGISPSNANASVPESSSPALPIPGTGNATIPGTPAATTSSTNSPAPLSSADVIAAVCSVRDASGGYTLAQQVGLGSAVCDRWAGMTEPQRQDCIHTFAHANSSSLVPSRAAMCSSAIGDAVGLTDLEMLACVRGSNMAEGSCLEGLRAPLVLSDNAGMAERLKRMSALSAARLTGDEESIRTIRGIAAKAVPSRDDVYQLSAMCRWDRGSPADARANEILAETFLTMPAAQRALCGEHNADCNAMTNVAEYCHAIQHKVGTNAFVAKVDQFYTEGEFGGSEHELARTMELYPEPYGASFSEILHACNVHDRTQGDVARTLISSSPAHVTRHRDLCSRINEGAGALPRMSGEMAAAVSMAAGRATRTAKASARR